MNFHRKLCFIFATGLIGTVAARADFVLTGVLVRPEGSSFGITDTATFETRWVGLGEAFSKSGWKIESYDAGTAKLKLTKDGSSQVLTLRNTVVRPVEPTVIVGRFQIKMGARAVAQDTSFTTGRETVISLSDGTTLRVTPSLTNDPGVIRYQMLVQRGTPADGSPPDTIARPTVKAPPGAPFTVEVDGGRSEDFTFTFTPRTAVVSPGGKG
jgi:hypothetical protein